MKPPMNQPTVFLPLWLAIAAQIEPKISPIMPPESLTLDLFLHQLFAQPAVLLLNVLIAPLRLIQVRHAGDDDDPDDAEEKAAEEPTNGRSSLARRHCCSDGAANDPCDKLDD